MVTFKGWIGDQIVLSPDNPVVETTRKREGPTLVGTVFLSEMPGHLSEAAGGIAALQGPCQATAVAIAGQ